MEFDGLVVEDRFDGFGDELFGVLPFTEQVHGVGDGERGAEGAPVRDGDGFLGGLGGAVRVRWDDRGPFGVAFVGLCCAVDLVGGDLDEVVEVPVGA